MQLHQSLFIDHLVIEQQARVQREFKLARAASNPRGLVNWLRLKLERSPKLEQRVKPQV